MSGAAGERDSMSHSVTDDGGRSKLFHRRWNHDAN